MEQVADLSERTRLDRVDEHPHPLVQHLRAVHRVRRALAALGAMLGGAVFGRVGDTARKERLAAAREILCLGEVGEDGDRRLVEVGRSEEHTSELQSLMRISYAVFCLKKKINTTILPTHT